MKQDGAELGEAQYKLILVKLPYKHWSFLGSLVVQKLTTPVRSAGSGWMAEYNWTIGNKAWLSLAIIVCTFKYPFDKQDIQIFMTLI